MAFEPTGGDSENPFGNGDVLRLPIQIGIPRRRPLTTRMWEKLFREMNEAALVTDLRLYEQATSFDFAFEQGREILLRQTNRFVVTSALSRLWEESF
ncbi:hypothetical protein ML401_01620 [Bradyrhizobium sp. 62B]|uniref:hypothetical protein n=1 Tax=Bradyrhizobium sp. 62B TaxID=2898442 RepID=UPI002557F522|nr:hypothetical protein ML401_01620 [Bradyrhizobium sp. 62B]